MDKKKVSELLKEGEPGQECHVQGWVRSKRTSKACGFLAINDGSSQNNLQAVVPNETSAFDLLKDCTTGASVSLRGKLVESPAKGQKVELAVAELEVIGLADSTYPLQKKGHTLEFLREQAHLRARTNTFGAVFRVRNALAQAVHQFFQDKGLLWVHTPIISASDCEGAGEQFTVTTLDVDKTPADFSQDFFGERAYLTVSGQLEAEFLATAVGGVYTFGPTFRAENSNTPRHLAEFWMIEPEVAFFDKDDCIALAEDFVKSVIRSVLQRCPDEFSFLSQFYDGCQPDYLESLASQQFVKISYTEAMETLKASKKTFEFPVDWGADLQTEHERFLTEEVHKKPVFVTDYPETIKPFYMRENDDGKTVAAFDLLVPQVGELLGGSQREERLDFLTRRMTKLGVSQTHLAWYTDLRRYGTVPHAGFGLGFERLIMYVTGMKNMRDVISCPRAPNLIKF